jgi:hypothetical protein
LQTDLSSWPAYNKKQESNRESKTTETSIHEDRHFKTNCQIKSHQTHIILAKAEECATVNRIKTYNIENET